MNLPIPTFLRQPSSERDQTIMRPSNDDFCIQLPNSDYLIPLSGPRGVAVRLLSEATGVTLSESVTTCSTIKTIAPSASMATTTNNNKMNPIDSEHCWETSFSMPSSSSEQLLLPPDERNSMHVRLDNGPQDGTTITIKPPISFGDMDSSSIPATITLDPSTLDKQQSHQAATHPPPPISYANVRMLNPPSGSECQSSSSISATDKLNLNGTANIERNAPFTIQGFNDRYIPKENHSEISC